VSAKDFVVAWDEDAEAVAAGAVRVEPAGGEVFLPGLVELVVLPFVVNIASTVLYDVVKRVVGRARKVREESELEVVEFTTAAGDRLVVVRARRVVS